uniref:Uncharacterized protein n=1 Tax=Molossus molossus TaxID=27622 RepID=A0A7J8FYQ6_MOLMO|nr:hypothetical protein HJG59_008232 [Molossus molossus]
MLAKFLEETSEFLPALCLILLLLKSGKRPASATTSVEACSHDWMSFLPITSVQERSPRSQTRPAKGEERISSHSTNYTFDSKRFGRLFNTRSEMNTEEESIASTRGLCKRPQFLLFKWRLDSSACSPGRNQVVDLKTFLCKGSFWKQHIPVLTSEDQ